MIIGRIASRSGSLNSGALDPNQINWLWHRENMMTGEELQELREELGWSQYFLAERLGVFRSSIAHWEQGRAPVPTNVAKAVREAARGMGKIRARMFRLMAA